MSTSSCKHNLPDAMARRYLIVRTSAIGDIVFASPFARAIKRSEPDAHLAWLVQDGLQPLLSADPCIDELIVWPRAKWHRLWRDRQWRQLWREVRSFARLLREHRFDVAIDLQGLLKSGWLTWLSAAPLRIGLGSREGSQWLMHLVIPKGGPPERISSEYLHLAQTLGKDDQDFLPRLHVGDETRRQMRERRQSLGLTQRRLAILTPFTTRPQKHWSMAAWTELAQKISQEWQMTPVVLGGPADRAQAQQLANAVPGLVNLAGLTRLDEAAAWVKQADLLIGVDTGLTHMGIAFARPTVAIFGSTCPYTDTGRDNAQVIWLGLPCSPCRRKPTCNGAFTCLSDISADMVMARARAAMQAPGHS